MTALSREYNDLLIETHTNNPDWGTSGELQAKTVIDLFETNTVYSILDYGCGKGKLIDKLTEYFMDKPDDQRPIISGYDPAVEAFKDNQYLSGDLVVCTDVLEHIEPDYLPKFLETIVQRANVMVYFTIALTPARMVLPDGRNAHLIVNNSQWWYDTVSAYFDKCHILDETSKELKLVCYKEKQNVH